MIAHKSTETICFKTMTFQLRGNGVQQPLSRISWYVDLSTIFLKPDCQVRNVHISDKHSSVFSFSLMLNNSFWWTALLGRTDASNTFFESVRCQVSQRCQKVINEGMAHHELSRPSNLS